MADSCVARREQSTNVLPTPRPVRHRPRRAATVLVLRDQDGAVLLEQRPSAGIWGGLLSLLEFDASATDAEIMAAVQTRYGFRIVVGELLGPVRHEFSHYSYLMHPRLAVCIGAAGVSSASLQPVSSDQLETAPLPAPIRRLLRQLDSPTLV